MRFKKLIEDCVILNKAQCQLGAQLMLQLRDPACRLPFPWVKLWWSLSYKWWLNSSYIAVCYSTEVPSWSSSAHWNQSTLSPLSSFTQAYPWLLFTQALYKNHQCFLTLLSQLSYLHHHSIVYPSEIFNLPFSLFQYDPFPSSISFLRARPTHVSFLLNF